MSMSIELLPGRAKDLPEITDAVAGLIKDGVHAKEMEVVRIRRVTETGQDLDCLVADRPIFIGWKQGDFQVLLTKLSAFMR